MLGSLGWQELLIVLVILALLFGANRVAGIGGALGKGIREFRSEARGSDDTPEAPATPPPAPPPPAASTPTVDAPVADTSGTPVPPEPSVPAESAESDRPVEERTPSPPGSSSS